MRSRARPPHPIGHARPVQTYLALLPQSQTHRWCDEQNAVVNEAYILGSTKLDGIQVGHGPLAPALAQSAQFIRFLAAWVPICL